MKYLILLFLFALSSCATLKPGDCNYEHGYAKGVNAAQADIPMSTNMDREGVCSPDGLAALQKGYREGYSFVLKSKPSTTNININNNDYEDSSNRNSRRECVSAYGRKVCGYNCVESHGNAKCAPRPDMECLSHWDVIECGYDCKSAGGKVKCGSKRGMKCLTHFDQVYCGYNCRSSYGQIICDK